MSSWANIENRMTDLGQSGQRLSTSQLTVIAKCKWMAVQSWLTVIPSWRVQDRLYL